MYINGLNQAMHVNTYIVLVDTLLSHLWIDIVLVNTLLSHFQYIVKHSYSCPQGQEMKEERERKLEVRPINQVFISCDIIKAPHQLLTPLPTPHQFGHTNINSEQQRIHEPNCCKHYYEFQSKFNIYCTIIKQL